MHFQVQDEVFVVVAASVDATMADVTVDIEHPSSAVHDVTDVNVEAAGQQPEDCYCLSECMVDLTLSARSANIV